MDFDALERLGRLRTSGAISDEEFESEKRRILGVTPARIPPRHVTDETSQEPFEEEGNRFSAGKIAAPAAVFAVGILALLAFAGSSRKAPNPPTTQFPLSAKYSLRSRVKGIHIAPTTALPNNPHHGDASCNSYEKKPDTDAARVVSSRGWHVTGDTTVGDVAAVSFVGACDPGQSGSYRPIDGNIALYDGTDLKAVIYGKSVGYIENGNEPTELLISANRAGRSVGKVVVSADRISVEK